MRGTVETYVGICGHSYKGECRCYGDALSGLILCDMCMDARRDLCPECYAAAHPPKKRWWLLGRVW